jgi:hypothetical protein
VRLHDDRANAIPVLHDDETVIGVVPEAGMPGRSE